jgi:hypothetical protein
MLVVRSGSSGTSCGGHQRDLIAQRRIAPRATRETLGVEGKQGVITVTGAARLDNGPASPYAHRVDSW